MEITAEVKSVIKNAAKKLTGHKRRAFQAQTALDLLDGNARQAEPCFRTTLAYTRITTKAVRAALIAEKGYTDEELPSERTMNNILNRLGYRLRRVEKTKPVKKIPEVDEIFAKVHLENVRADADPHTLRISVDVKAKLNIGFFSRGGKARGQQAKKAADHDTNPVTKLAPCGILEVVAGYLLNIPGAKTLRVFMRAPYFSSSG